jgi:LDH2 family malate/lactate/ureidoglycolate dehydrogenase
MEALQQEYFALLKSSQRQPGVEEILLPGEPEQRTAAARRRDGLPLDPGTVSGLDELAARLGMPPLSDQALDAPQ